MGYVRKAGEGMVEDPTAAKDPLEQLYKEGKLKLIDKTEEDSYQSFRYIYEAQQRNGRVIRLC